MVGAARDLHGTLVSLREAVLELLVDPIGVVRVVFDPGPDAGQPNLVLRGMEHAGRVMSSSSNSIAATSSA